MEIAIEMEINAVENLHSWELGSPSSHKIILDTKQVLSKMRDNMESMNKYKMMSVACRTEKSNDDMSFFLEETFTVVKMT